MALDRETATRLFLGNERMLRDYIRGLVRLTSDADDVFQETGIKVLNAEAYPDDEAVFPAWCRGVARNVILHYWRDKRRSRVVADTRLLDAFERAYEDADAEGDLWNDRRRALEDCVRGLPEASREVLHSRYRESRSFDEVAAATGKAATALRMMVSRLRRELLKCVERRLAPEGRP